MELGREKIGTENEKKEGTGEQRKRQKEVERRGKDREEERERKEREKRTEREEREEINGTFIFLVTLTTSVQTVQIQLPKKIALIISNYY